MGWKITKRLSIYVLCVLNKERFFFVKKVYLKEIIEIELDEYSRIIRATRRSVMPDQYIDRNLCRTA
jgi:hypothetical protein